MAHTSNCQLFSSDTKKFPFPKIYKKKELIFPVIQACRCWQYLLTGKLWYTKSPFHSFVSSCKYLYNVHAGVSVIIALRRVSTLVLSVANTVAPCCIHTTQVHHPVTLFWHRANQSWFYPLNAERLARKQPVPIVTPLVRRSRGSNLRSPDYEANDVSTWPPSRPIHLYIPVFV